MEKVRVIPMGVELQNLFIPPENRKVSKTLLFVGRLVEKKGLRYLIEAMPTIVKKHPDAQLRVVGDGQESNTLKNLSAELGMAQKIQFLGALTNETLPKLYQTADVVVFPSIVAADGDREGFGLVLVEALGCECAAVVTDLPAMRDIVHDGKTALVVPQKNAKQIADKVMQLLNNPSLRRSLGETGRQYVVQRFDWKIVVGKYANLIDKVLDNRHRHG
jgi:glycosyltransferase involved in cell wall biosynthesis